MRIVTQIGVVAALAAAGAAGWYYFAPARLAPTPAQAQSSQRPTVRPVGVEMATARTGVVESRLESVGTSRANEAITVASKVPGIIVAINFTEGQRVKAGDVLVELDAKERRAEIAEVKVNLDEARRRVERARQLRQGGNVAEARLEELLAAAEALDAKLRAAEARLSDTRIVAPFAGRVGLREVSVGTLLQAGMPITTLDDISRVKVSFSVPETALAGLTVGLKVNARSTAFRDRTFVGEVTVFDTRVDPVTRAVRVNSEFANADEILRPGMFLLIEMVTSRRENAVLIPEEALVPESDRQYVFVVRDGKAVRRPVTLGERLVGEVEVLEGVAAGETLVARGTQRIRDGSPVEPLVQKPTS